MPLPASHVQALPAPDALRGPATAQGLDGIARLLTQPLVRRFAVAQLSVAVMALVAAPAVGVSVAWGTGLGSAALLALLAALGLWYAATGTRRNKAHVADAILVMFLLLLFTNIGGPAQYVGVAFALPLVDPWLAAGDAALGIHVPAVAAWTTGVPWLAAALTAAYATLLPQFVVPPIVLGLWYRNRKAMWEFLFHFHVCLLATLFGAVFLPTACPFLFYGDFPQIFEHERFIRHFEALRSGAGFVVSYDDIDGLISIPSFHTAGGLMVTWAFRQHPTWLAAFAALNVFLIAATVLSGTHYGVDVLVTVGIFGVSLALWRVWGQHRLSTAGDDASGSRSSHRHRGQASPPTTATGFTIRVTR
jgi:hypothetical protein